MPSNDTTRQGRLNDAPPAKDVRSLQTGDTSRPCHHFAVPQAKRGRALPSNDTTRQGRLNDAPPAKDVRSLQTGDTSRPCHHFAVPQAKRGRALPSNDTSRPGRLYDVRRAFPCLQMTLHDTVVLTTFRKPLFGFK